jgi:hypothetical protein
MKLKELRKIANESLFTPNKADRRMKIIMDVGDQKYWVRKSIEHLMIANDEVVGCDAWHEELRQATTLLILARAWKDI